MKYANYILVFCLLGLMACQAKEQTPEQFTENLPQVHPKKISQVQKVDSLYFGYLGNESIPMEDGTVVLALGESKRLLQINQKGELVTQIARPGRGPGEVQDILFMQESPDGGLLVVDQGNEKIIRFNSDLELLTELTPKSSRSDVITGVYPTEREGLYVLRSSSGAYLFDQEKSPAMMLKKFSVDEGFKQTITVSTRPVSLTMFKGRPSGSREVPYSPSQQISYHPDTQSLYSYWTGSSHIAELSADFDTLNTIAVELPSQEFG